MSMVSALLALNTVFQSMEVANAQLIDIFLFQVLEVALFPIIIAIVVLMDTGISQLSAVNVIILMYGF